MKRILVVDDEEMIREILKKFLEMNGYKVICCADGIEALLYMEENCQIPHLIITDFQMPKMDGVTLTKNIKTFFPKARIIITTARPDLLPENHLADAILSKPYNFNELQVLVEKLTNY
jgi:two-component system chemotaxis response regulator CheY